MRKLVLQKIFGTISIFLIVLSGCEIKYPPNVDSVMSVISNLVIPDTLYLNSDTPSPIKVKVTDPQGREDISLVKFTISDMDRNEIFYSDTLEDNGLYGDVIAQDGEYYSNIPSNFTNIEGVYMLTINAKDFSGNNAVPLQDTLWIVKGEANLPPVICNPLLPDSLDSESIKNAFFSITAVDPQGLTDIDSVFLLIYPPLKSSPVYKCKLGDDGVEGDLMAGDSIFSIRQDLSQELGSSGINLVRFQAVDKREEKSNPVVKEMVISLSNEPPTLSNLTAPDILSRNNTQASLLSVEVTDPQGASDIDIVFFNSFLPDGSASQGNPHLMYDNGENGDVTSNDGIFSLIINITPSVDLGDYKFEFMARDNSKAMSDTLKHIITIVD